LKKEIRMKFEKNRVLLDGSIEKTRDFEGGNFWLFVQAAPASVGFDASGIIHLLQKRAHQREIGT